MTENEYVSYLSDLESKLAVWEKAITKIDPASDQRVSYSVGDMIVKQKQIALMEISYARQFIQKQRIKHTVSGELALGGFVRGVLDSADSIVEIETANNLTLSNLEAYAPEMSKSTIRIANDAQSRVELLKKGNLSVESEGPSPAPINGGSFPASPDRH